MIFVVANNILPFMGTAYLCTIVWKIARKYPFRRWFF